MESGRWQRLLEVAASEFARNGYQRASLNRIIRTCGMSKSSFYHFFDSKAELFNVVVEEASIALARDLQIPAPDAFDGSDFWRQIGRLAEHLARLSESESWYVDFGKLFYLPDTPLESSTALQGVNGRIAQWIEAVVEQGQQAGAIRTDLPHSLLVGLTLSILRSLDAWTLHHMPEISPEDRPTLGHQQLDIMQRVLAP